jgi:glyoxylase-like metal-dependent hydrolase (beta-lactamase superfamily II)
VGRDHDDIKSSNDTNSNSKFESIQFIPTPGHTIDHYSVLVGQPGRADHRDMIHSPIQAEYLELGMRADDSPAGRTNAAQGARALIDVDFEIQLD